MANKKYLFLLIVLILGLSWLSYWQFKKFEKTLPEVNLPEMEIPKMEMDLKSFLPPEKEGDKEWISPDGKLKLKYSAHWTEGYETFLKQFNQSHLPEAEILFFAHQLKLAEQAIAFLLVEKTGPEKNLDEIIKEVEKNILKQGGEMEIVNLKTENKTAWLEAKFKKKMGFNLYLKGKIIFNLDRTYLISFIVFEKDWQKFKGEAEEILGSAQLIF